MANSNYASTDMSISIKPLLHDLRPAGIGHGEKNHADAIAFAISNIFKDQLSPVQTALLLYNLSLTGLEQDPEVLAKCAVVMREAAVPVDKLVLRNAVIKKGHSHGHYAGGLCDIVGTGGDFHSTFNISTASSILASSLLLIAKHGNRASTSKSGSADVLGMIKTPTQPKLEAITPALLASVYEKTNYAFLFAPNFHTALRHVGSIRKEMPCPTIFNLLGPLTNPASSAIEAQVIGVKKTNLVPVFAEALLLNGSKKAMVVCGAEDLDEISCAGPTHCARLVESTTSGESKVQIERFTLTPSDFGLPAHPLSGVSPGLTPSDNAKIMLRLLSNELALEDPILHFVLMNTASLFVISGICDSETSPFEEGGNVISEKGPGGGRWKEGVRLARLAISTGRAFQMLKKFAELTNA